MALNAAATALGHESIWLDANRYYDAERAYYEIQRADYQIRANPGSPNPPVLNGISNSSLASEIAFARQKIQKFLKSGETGSDFSQGSVLSRLDVLEKAQATMITQMKQLTTELAALTVQLTSVSKLIVSMDHQNFQGQVLKDEKKEEGRNVNSSVQNGSSVTADDDDLDLFGSDEDDASAAKLREERLQAYAEKKSKKPVLVAKSSVVLDVKPWSDETDMKELENAVRAVQCDGLKWGAGKLVPLAYGISKFQIVAIVEDEKVSIDWLTETISDNDELVQSVDVAAFNKL